MIPYGSVNGTGGLLPAFKPDSIEAVGGDRHISTDYVLIAVSHKRLSADGSYGALLSPHILSEVMIK